MAVFPEGYPWNDMTDWFRDESAAGLFFYAQTCIWNFAADAACGPCGGQGRKDSPPRLLHSFRVPS